jgi:hypothetical protein
MSLFEPIFTALNRAQVRYVVVGGVAMVLHGHARLTVDIDLVVDLDDEPAARAIDALIAMGLRPRAPVNPRDFADRSIREAWVRDRAMQVFSVSDPANPMRAIDLFVTYPIPFEALWTRSQVFDIQGAPVHVASIEDLIHLKRLAGRPQDEADVRELEAILALKRGSPG